VLHGGRLLYPFIFLVLAFLGLLAIAMRGTGAAPTVVPASATGDAAAGKA
jgi:hypothetical protein